jgi:hypothetical protein
MPELPPHSLILHLAQVVESSDDAIVTKALDSTITSWNAAAERMFGYTSDEAVGRSIRMIIPPELQSEEDAVLAQIRAGNALRHFETVWPTAPWPCAVASRCTSRNRWIPVNSWRRWRRWSPDRHCVREHGVTGAASSAQAWRASRRSAAAPKLSRALRNAAMLGGRCHNEMPWRSA